MKCDKEVKEYFFGSWDYDFQIAHGLIGYVLCWNLEIINLKFWPIYKFFDQ